MKTLSPGAIASMLPGSPLVVMLDIDGTLCDLVELPGDALVPDSVRAALVLLMRQRARGVHVALVTGRSVADARRMVGLDGLSIYGNHGMERLLESGAIRRSQTSDRSAASLRASTSDFAQLVATFPGTSLEDKHLSLSLHFRGMKRDLIAEFDTRAAAIARKHGVRTSPGKCVINILPDTSLNKGDAVREIVQETGGASPGASLLFVGDDVTDEDAFVELNSLSNAVTVRVGDPTSGSAAQHALADPRAVRELLENLAGMRT